MPRCTPTFFRRLCRASAPMNLVDEVTLNDYEKYRKYRRWPWKLIWHAALIALVSAQSLIYVTEDGRYYRNMRRTWYYYFFPPEWAPTETEGGNTHYIYTQADTVDAVRNAVAAYDDIQAGSVSDFNRTAWWPAGACARGCVQATVERYASAQLFNLSTDFDPTIETNVYWLNASAINGTVNARADDDRLPAVLSHNATRAQLQPVENKIKLLLPCSPPSAATRRAFAPSPRAPRGRRAGRSTSTRFG